MARRMEGETDRSGAGRGCVGRGGADADDDMWGRPLAGRFDELDADGMNDDDRAGGVPDDTTRDRSGQQGVHTGSAAAAQDEQLRVPGLEWRGPCSRPHDQSCRHARCRVLPSGRGPPPPAGRGGQPCVSAVKLSTGTARPYASVARDERKTVHDAQRAAAGGSLGGRPVHGFGGRAGAVDPDDDGTRLPAGGHRSRDRARLNHPVHRRGSALGGRIGEGAAAVPVSGGVERSRKRSSSTGKGRTRVEFFSAATSTTVCRRRSCSAAGCSVMTSAAWASFREAWSSPSAVMMRERRSRSASAWRDMERLSVSGRGTS